MRGKKEPQAPSIPPPPMPWYLRLLVWAAYLAGAAIGLFALLALAGGVAAGSKRGRGR